MSTTIIRLIPTDPEYVPQISSQRQARELLGSFVQASSYNTGQVAARVTEQIEFVDQGSNFERIVCPFCLWKVPMDWWRAVMDQASARRFADLSVTLPCCRMECSLNDLIYEWPAGFARFVLEMYEPFTIDRQGVAQMLELNRPTLARLQDILGCGLRIIWAQY